MRKFKVVTILAVFTLLGTTTPSVAVGGPAKCQTFLNFPQQGREALSNLGSMLPQVASINNRSAAEITELLINDNTFWLDQCGFGFYVEPTSPNKTTSYAVASAPFAYSDTFKLHSKPGSNRTIYLDFNGHTISNTQWNTYFNVASTYTASGYSQDSDFSTFNNAEMDAIQSIWQRISEDYAPFDIDVTTELPAAGVLERSSTSDLIYGTRAVITADTNLYSKCSCGGIAYVGVYNATGAQKESTQPAWVFTRGVGNSAKYIAEAASHEVGHNLGLRHDGTSTAGYYSGTAGWAPIMGVGYYQGLTQWSKGEYSGANNQENDYSVMQSYGAPLVTDEDSNSPDSGRSLSTTLSGVVSSPTDSDWFKITPSTTGNVTITASPAVVSPNLDIRLDAYDSNTLSPTLTFGDPPMSVVSGDSINGLSASITFNATAGTTYYIKLDGVGFGDPLTTGYSDYGSVGRYNIELSSSVPVASLSITTTSLPNGALKVNYSAQLAATGGSPSYTWSIASGSLPPGLSLNASTGVISGRPSKRGTFSFTIRVTDALSATATQLLSITVN